MLRDFGGKCFISNVIIIIIIIIEMKICVRCIFCFIRIPITRMRRPGRCADLGTLAHSYLREKVTSLEVAFDWPGIS